MTLHYLLDTVTCIRAMRADAASTLAGRFNRHSRQICTSSVVLAELHFGAEKSQRVAENLLRLEGFVARLERVLDFDAMAAAEYGLVRTSLRHAPIGPLDTLIAAHARSRSLTVVTGNVREFLRVPGLSVEDWQ